MDRGKKTIGTKKTSENVPSASRIVASRYLQSGKGLSTNLNKNSFLEPTVPKSCTRKQKTSNNKECLSTKTSTPTKEEEVPSLSSLDLSNISMCSAISVAGTNVKSGGGKKTTAMSKKQNNAADQFEVDLAYNEYLQTMYIKMMREKEIKKEKEELERVLTTLQGCRISKELELHNLKKKLQEVSANCAIEERLKGSDTVDCANILEQVTAGNFEEQLDRVTEQLEGSLDKLLLQNVQVPQCGEGQLGCAIDESLGAVDQLHQLCNSEESQIKIKTIELEKSTKDGLKRCADKITQLEQLSCYSNSLKIDAQRIDSEETNPFY